MASAILGIGEVYSTNDADDTSLNPDASGFRFAWPALPYNLTFRSRDALQSLTLYDTDTDLKVICTQTKSFNFVRRMCMIQNK
jgi:hypothetical protein